MKRLLGFCSSNYYVLIIGLAFMVIALIGTKGIIFSVVCVMLALTGITYEKVSIDWSILVPLMLMCLLGIGVTYYHTDTLTSGYTMGWIVFPLLYMLVGGLDEKEEELLKELIVYIVASIACIGIIYYIVRHDSSRLGGLLGNPNSLGIFLAVGYMLSIDRVRVRWVQSIILVGLSLTLSMGSFISMGIALVIMSVVKGSAVYLVNRLIEIGVTFWVGLLLYVSMQPWSLDWLWVITTIMAIALVVVWGRIPRVKKINWVSWVILVGCMELCIGIVVLRPSMLSTFIERLNMILDGCSYLFKDVFGVGPMNWRGLDISDGGIYYGTWFIHNVYIHIGVEMGILVLMCFVWVTVWFFSRCIFIKRTDIGVGNAIAFFIHSLFDIAFFRICIPVEVMLSCSNVEERRSEISGIRKNVIFMLLLVISVLVLFEEVLV